MKSLSIFAAKMRHNPRDWRIEDLISIADRLEIVHNQPGTSHVTFRAINGARVTVPSHKPIKPIYIAQFVDMVNNLLGGKNE